MKNSMRNFAGLFKAAVAAAFLICPHVVAANSDMGLLETSVPLPDVPIRMHDGSTTSLHTFAQDHVTAVQLIFTTCSTVCPIQGSTFGLVADAKRVRIDNMQLLSISIDANYDKPDDLKQWRAQFYEGEGWMVGVTDFFSTHALVDELLRSVDGNLMSDSPVPSVQTERPDERDHHGSNVFFVGPDAKVLYRSVGFPTNAAIINVLQDLSARN